MQTPDDFKGLKLRFYEARDARIAYRVVGDGPPLMLVHGWPFHGFTFRRILPELARSFTCVVPDLVGMGDSEWRRDTDFTFPGQAARLQALADELGWTKYAVLAHDTGASIARFLALQDTCLSKLVLLNTEIPHHRLPWVPLYRALSFVPGSSYGFRILLGWRPFLRSPAGFGGSFVDRNLIDGEFRANYLQPLLREPRRMVGALRYIQDGLDYPLIDTLSESHGRITAECLFIWGADDPTFPEHLARKMAGQFMRVRAFHSVPGARLLVHEEKPDEVVRLAVPFLSK
jgi:pimeloyl-ACP methyl ester carboxylesterase